MKNANINPNIKVQLNGFQKETLSPPKKICGFNSLNKVTKLMLNPMAIGIKPRIAANAVSNTGIILVLPACTNASFVFMPLALNTSVNSIIKIPFFTTIPASPTIPKPVITPDTFIPNMENPNNTPMILNKISVNIITDLEIELNCNTKVKRININAMIIAFPKKLTVSNCCWFSPVCFIVTPSCKPLKLEMYCAITAFTEVGLNPCANNTFELN